MLECLLYPVSPTDQVIQVSKMMFPLGGRLTGETLLCLQDIAHTFLEPPGSLKDFFFSIFSLPLSFVVSSGHRSYVFRASWVVKVSLCPTVALRREVGFPHRY